MLENILIKIFEEKQQVIIFILRNNDFSLVFTIRNIEIIFIVL